MKHQGVKFSLTRQLHHRRCRRRATIINLLRIQINIDVGETEAVGGEKKRVMG